MLREEADMTEPRPTLDTVAAAAGVSRMTVSNAYNRPDQLSTATRQRVLQVAEELGYSGPDPAGASLRRKHVDAVGVLITEQLAYAFTDPGLVSFMQGVSTELGAAGQSMVLVPTSTQSDGSFVRSAIVDAFIVCSMESDDPVMAAVKSRRLPMVTAGSPRLPHVPFVGVDGRKAGAMVAEHLLSLGHKRFGVVIAARRDVTQEHLANLPSRPGTVLRVDGFTSTLRAAGINDKDITVVTSDLNTSESSARAVRELLTRPDSTRPTAIFGITDVLALGALAAAAELGLGVPQQLSVAGYDDINAAAHSKPALTTISQSLYDQGVLTARLALALVAGETPKSPRLSPELVVRESTAPPPRKR
jgi:DNA-binding LacI/PurR family transcriptional regulator